MTLQSGLRGGITAAAQTAAAQGTSALLSAPCDTAAPRSLRVPGKAASELLSPHLHCALFQGLLFYFPFSSNRALCISPQSKHWVTFLTGAGTGKKKTI